MWLHVEWYFQLLPQRLSDTVTSEHAVQFGVISVKSAVDVNISTSGNLVKSSMTTTVLQFACIVGNGPRESAD